MRTGSSESQEEAEKGRKTEEKKQNLLITALDKDYADTCSACCFYKVIEKTGNLCAWTG
jgi:hypothetical protein